MPPPPPTPVAPSLRDVIRISLEKQQISAESIAHYLGSLTSLPRYESSFKAFWHFCIKLCDPLSASTFQVASWLLQFNAMSPSAARNAYSALLLIPDMSNLRFCTLLNKCKRQWNQSSPRYPAFWDANDVLQKLESQPFDWKNMVQLRERLILSWRILMLYRSVDLARLYRVCTRVHSMPYVWVQRKGWHCPRWEAVLQLPDRPHICPWTLLKAYVAATRTLVPSGSLVLRSVLAPFKELSANAIGSVTKDALSKLGLDTKFWKAHSTRGAGVCLYKKIGPIFRGSMRNWQVEKFHSVYKPLPPAGCRGPGEGSTWKTAAGAQRLIFEKRGD